MRRESLKLWDLVRLISEPLGYAPLLIDLYFPCLQGAQVRLNFYHIFQYHNNNIQICRVHEFNYSQLLELFAMVHHGIGTLGSVCHD